MEILLNKLIDEIWFKTSRSGGKGGQNVNKVSTKVELLFSIINSIHLTEEQKFKLRLKYKNRIDSEGYLRIVSQEDRSQYKNKINALAKFKELIIEGLKVKKKRIKTSVPKSVKTSRVKLKKSLSEKKLLRRDKSFLDDN